MDEPILVARLPVPPVRVPEPVRGAAVGILWVLATVQLVVGTWALVAPLVFYEGFPLPAHDWSGCCRRTTSISCATSER